MTTDEQYALRGAPSYVWRAGQDRRLAMIRQWYQPTDDALILIDGVGVGTYATPFLEDTPHVYGFDIEMDRVRDARQHAPNTHVAAAEAVPYPSDTFRLILSHGSTRTRQ